MNARSETAERSYVRSRYAAMAFGIASLAIGIGLVYSIVTDSVAVFVGVLAATLALTVVSLLLAFRTEGVLTRENGVVGGFVVLALALLVGLHEYTTLPSAVVLGSVIGVGVIVPRLVLDHTRLGAG